MARPWSILICGAAILGIPILDVGGVELTDAVSREFSFRNEGPFLFEYANAVSREFSFRNEPILPFEQTSVHSREYSYENDSPNVFEFTSVVSREHTFRNESPNVFTFTTAVSREFTLFNNTVHVQPIADAVIAAGQPYTGPTPTLDFGAPPITWSIEAGPQGMVIAAATGVVTWDNPGPPGTTVEVVLRATNAESSAEVAWGIRVVAPPVIAEIPDAATPQSAAYTGPKPSVQPEADPVSWSLLEGPTGMSINPATGVVSWPDPVTDGSPFLIRVGATNPAGSDDAAWMLTVQPLPVIAEIADATITELAPYSLAPALIKGTPPVSWSLVSGPEGLTVDPLTGAVLWPAPVGSPTPYSITIKVTDAYGTDTESWQLTVPITYTAKVSASPKQAPAGTPILLQGTATKIGTDDPAPNARVSIRIRVQGTRRVMTSLSDASGKFQAIFYPLAGEAGVYSVGADHPGVVADKTDDTFTLYGMQCVPATVTEKLIPGQLPKTAEVSLRNLGDTPLTGLQAFVEGAAPNLSVQTNVPAGLPVYGQSWLRYTVVAMDATVPSSTVTIRVTSAEGAVAVLNVNVQVSPLVPHLVASPTSVQAAMLRGTQTLVQFDVTNDGGAASEAVSVQIPSVPWMTLATPGTLDPLAPGEKTGVVLNLTPAPDLPLGAYQGTIIVSTNLSSVTVPFRFEAMSDRKGDLRVTVTDEYTYWATGSPRVANAAVTVKSVGGEVIANGTTDSSGIVLFTQITEAYYTVEVSAPDHGEFSTQVLVAAAAVKDLEAFLPRQLVRYNWTVVPTQIVDEYRVTVETVFETHVPAPVVTIEPSFVDLNLIGCEEQIDFTIRNHGLITANDVKILYQSSDRYELMPLVTVIGDLPPLSTARVPVRIRNKACPSAHPPTVAAVLEMSSGVAAVNRIAASEGGDPCNRVKMEERHSIICGVPRTYTTSVHFREPGAVCGGPCIGCDGGNGGIGGVVGGGGPIVIGPGKFTPIHCLPCVPKCLETLLFSCLPIKWDTCAKAGISCGRAAASPSAGKVAKCVIGIGACAGFSGAKAVAKYLGPGSLICLCKLLRDCNCLLTGPGPNPAACIPCDPFELFDQAINYARGRGFCPQSDVSSLLLDAGGAVNLSAYETYLKWYEQAMYVFAATYYPFNAHAWIAIPESQADVFVSWKDAFSRAAEESSDEGYRVSESERTDLLARQLPEPVTEEVASAFLARWNRSLEYEARAIRNAGQVPAGESTDFIEMEIMEVLWDRAVEADELAMSEGYTSALDALVAAMNRLYGSLLSMPVSGDAVAPTADAALLPAADPANESGVCARVRLQINQEALVSRGAFKATLELVNSGTTALENIQVAIAIHDTSKSPANDRFGIHPPVLNNITDVAGSGFLAGGTTATAEWTIVPGDLAAPLAPAAYFVGGTLSYSVNGAPISVPLFPAEITVLPNPSLRLKYFLEKVVYSDDPFTPELEPAVPFSLGLIMRNSGAGLANNVRITSGQPKIVENEKGLLIDFVIIGTKVGGRSYSPSLTAALGDLGPGQTEVAQWLMTSSLQGQFIEYSATFEHVNGLNNPQLSIMDSVSIHEMIHVVRTDKPTDDGKPDFLANDIIDPDVLPDALHSSTGEVWPVAAVTSGLVNGSIGADHLEVQLTAAMPSGWAYLRVDNPAGPDFRLSKVVRPDGSEVRVGENAWTTRRVVRLEGQPSRQENLLHILDHDGPGAYTLVYTSARPPSDADLDQNGTVDGVDWSLFQAGFGRSQGEDDFNPNADLDKDGKVTFADQQLWLAAYRLFVGNPNAPAPAPVPLSQFFGDLDRDNDVDAADFGILQRCYSGRGVVQRIPGCEAARLDGDLDIDLDDVTRLIDCASGPGLRPPATCRRY